MHAADGTCVIDVFQKDGATLDFATGQDISRAALRVINTCVSHNEGGYLSGVGTFIPLDLRACCLGLDHGC